jgi:hypothetical protein
MIAGVFGMHKTLNGNESSSDGYLGHPDGQNHPVLCKPAAMPLMVAPSA